MSAQPDHYQILGLPPSATPEQIKKKYRELARRFHPDVNPSPDASQMILGINQAYHILGDPGRRAAYDAERHLLQAASHPRPTPPASPSPRARHPASSSSDQKGRYDFDGFGRSTRQPVPEVRPPRPATRTSAGPKPDSQEKSIQQALTEAKLAFINRQFREAMRLCQDVLRINPREAIAHEILGDIYVRQGDTQRAGTAFAYAIQFNPRNQSAQVKLERLNHMPSRPASSPTITFSGSHFTPPPSAPLPDAALAILTVLAFGALIAVSVLIILFPGNPVAEGLGGLGLSLNLFAALGAAGAAGGILLAFLGRMRPVSEELWGQGKNGGSSRPSVPLGLLLTISAFVWFYASFLAYIGLAALRNRFSPSILRAYAATLALVVLFSLLYRPVGAANAGWQVTLLAGNILFPCLLFGWFLGDAFRLRGRM